MDEPILAVKGGNCLEKSNSAWYQKISQFQQESHLWYLGERASFYPSLPCLFLNRSLIDFPINHTRPTQTASVLERRLALLFNDVRTADSQTQQQISAVF